MSAAAAASHGTTKMQAEGVSPLSQRGVHGPSTCFIFYFQYLYVVAHAIIYVAEMLTIRIKRMLLRELHAHALSNLALNLPECCEIFSLFYIILTTFKVYEFYIIILRPLKHV